MRRRRRGIAGLANHPHLRDVVQRFYDLSPDGTQFLMLRESDEPNRIVVVPNWASELRERRAAAKAQSTGAH